LVASAGADLHWATMRNGVVGGGLGLLLGLALGLGVTLANPTECAVVALPSDGARLSELLNAGWAPDQVIRGPGIYCGKRPLIRWP
jgi:hypothetical protein